jgi:hypothetical protein
MESAFNGEHIRAAPMLHAQCDGENDAGSLRLLSQGRLFRRVPEVPLHPTIRRCLTMVFSCAYTEWHKHWMALCQ